MKDADIGVGWIDNQGKVYFQVFQEKFSLSLISFSILKDRYSFDFVRPVIDNTTNDWIPIQGKESNGWTAIQFKRLLDTCDSMDYPIKVFYNKHILLYL